VFNNSTIARRQTAILYPFLAIFLGKIKKMAVQLLEA